MMRLEYFQNVRHALDLLIVHNSANCNAIGYYFADFGPI
jgi:hypothetical protein